MKNTRLHFYIFFFLPSALFQRGKLSRQDAEEQGKGRKEQEEGKERERGAQARARLQRGRAGVRPGITALVMQNPPFCNSRHSLLYFPPESFVFPATIFCVYRHKICYAPTRSFVFSATILTVQQK
jgi:hypothetical protein